MDDRHLFRGKRVDNGEWVEGYYRVDQKQEHLIYPNDYSIHYNERDFIYECFKINPDTVSQCTGLHAAKSYRGESYKDKLVFEGDIVKVWGKAFEVKCFKAAFGYWAKYPGFVSFNQNKNFEWIDDITFKDVKIIGNIHDNPELLEDT